MNLSFNRVKKEYALKFIQKVRDQLVGQSIPAEEFYLFYVNNTQPAYILARQAFYVILNENCIQNKLDLYKSRKKGKTIYSFVDRSESVDDVLEEKK